MITKTKYRLERSLKRIFKIITRPEMVILPGNIAFSLILSIFPLIMILGFVVSSLGVQADQVLNILSVNLPDAIYDLIINFLSSERSFAWITFIVGLYFSSNGTKSIIVAANILYKTEEKNNLKRRVKSLFLAILLIFVFVFTMIVLGFGSTILKTVINLLDGNYDTVYKIITILKWPLSFFWIYFFLKILYTISPSISIKSSSVTKGALFTTFGWTISSFLYSLYLTNFARYDIFYGSLASIIIMMVWVYILSSILVIGIGINANAYLEETKGNDK